MNRKHLLSIASAASALVFALGAGACGSSDGTPADATTLAIKLTDSGCEPHEAKVPAGPVAFEIENVGTSKVTEVEIMEGDEVLGEEENITEGLDGSFSTTLAAGSYTIYCPGGSAERGSLTVTGAEHLEGVTKGESDTDKGR